MGIEPEDNLQQHLSYAAQNQDLQIVTYGRKLAKISQLAYTPFSSVADPCYFVTDPDPRFRTSD